MIISIQSILLAGVLVSIVLSTCLAVFIMRSFTTRLSHVMDNTARLLKREMLDAPKRGGDEIAYLDAMLYDAGNRLLQLEAFKKELVSIVSHELRTPLLSISSALELFDQGLLGELSEKGKNRLKFAQSETTRLIRLINDLLDIEKMEAGKFILDISEISVEELVEQAISSVAELAELKGIKLQTKYSQAGMSIEADSDRICQVLINFLSNAIKYSPEDSTVINSVEHNISQLMFSVEDRGRGIPEALKEKIFERFVQVEKTDATEKGGTGLGLAISRAIVEQHGGTIGVESATGVGSKFWFTLPAKGVKLI
jgi:signal transduction histidine kinase